MSMRIFSLGFCSCFAVVACAPESAAPDGQVIECALEGSADYSADCVLEVVGNGAFVIHAPNGGFYRFRYDAAQRLIFLADSADETIVPAPSDTKTIEIRLESNRYRLELRQLSDPAN